MKYGFIITGAPAEVVSLAQEAEAAGWDGVFLPDDWTTAWIKLTAIAMRTQRIRLGTMLTPLPEQLPWYIAAQTATLDQLSHGRVILTAGLGVLDLDKFSLQDNKLRAQRLDESLVLINSWWRGESLRTFTYSGQHYQLQEMRADVDWSTHVPQQKPRIPIWVVGGPKQSQLHRAARWDGAVIAANPPARLHPSDLHDRKAAIEALRPHSSPLDIIVEGESSPYDLAGAAEIARSYADAGATWWLESMWDLAGVTRDYDMHTRIRSGPPSRI